MKLRTLPMLFAPLLLLAALGPARSAPVTERRALVVGISRYDAATGLPDLPQMEASARQLAHRLERLPGYDPSRVQMLVHRVTRADLLAAVRSAAASASPHGTLLVALLCADARGGLQASDGRVAVDDLRRALESTRAAAGVLLVDAGSAVDLDLRLTGRPWAVLSSARDGQSAWPLFLPAERGRVDFLSAAAAGWARAMKREDGGIVGALGDGRCLTVEDLDLAARQTVAMALPANREGRMNLDPQLGGPALDAIIPATMRDLRRRGSIPMETVRKEWTAGRFLMLAGVLATLASERVRELGRADRQRLLDAIHGRTGGPALQRLHRALLRRGLLETPPADERSGWRRLEEARGSRVVAVVAPLRQEGWIAGEKEVAVAGPGIRCRYRVAYGSYEGRLDGHASVRIRLQIFGTAVNGRWEGWFRGRWLRGRWQGRYDPRSGRVAGQSLSALGSETAPVRLPARFDGTVEGARIRGTWRSPVPPLAGIGHWTLHK